jgi:hypothetical protein
MITVAGIPVMITMVIVIMTAGIQGETTAISINAEILMGEPCEEACMEVRLSAGTRA